MTKSIIPLLLLIFTSSCCNYDFNIPEKHMTEINSFKKGEIIYFESNLNDIDTIKIVGIDFNEVCGTFGISAPYSKLNLRIEHLPKNNWNDGTIITKKGNKIKLNQSLISIYKSANSEKPNTTINYRDFYSELKENETDSIQIIKSKNSEININSESIKEIYWSNDFGITGYKKNDGQIYKRKN